MSGGTSIGTRSRGTVLVYTTLGMIAFVGFAGGLHYDESLGPAGGTTPGQAVITVK
jgi:hypothetical protein